MYSLVACYIDVSGRLLYNRIDVSGRLLYNCIKVSGRLRFNRSWSIAMRKVRKPVADLQATGRLLYIHANVTGRLRLTVSGRLLYNRIWSLCFIVPPALELIHIGKEEIRQRIDSMEAAYSQLITWSASADSAVLSSQWGDNNLVVGDPKRQSGSKVKSFIADSFGFASNGELHNVSNYLKTHGGFELEMVGGSTFVCLTWFILLSIIQSGSG